MLHQPAVQSWRGYTNDPNAADHKSTEFGWSVMPGGSNKQRSARALRRPFRLSAWESTAGSIFFDAHVRLFLRVAWSEAWHQFPSACSAMLAATPEAYRLEGTGFTKVTLAINNPTPLHFDDNNFGITILVCVDLDGDLDGGSHLICDFNFEAAVLVHTDSVGIWLVGDYRRILHANAATKKGRRFIFTAYCSKSLVDLTSSHG